MEWHRQWVKPQILIPESISKLNPNSCYKVSLHVLAALWKDIGHLVHGKPSVSFDRFCCMTAAWQYLEWKRGKEGHEVKCSKDKSYWHGNRLILANCKHTEEFFRERPWNRNIQRTRHEQRCHSVALHSWCWSARSLLDARCSKLYL